MKKTIQFYQKIVGFLKAYYKKIISFILTVFITYILTNNFEKIRYILFSDPIPNIAVIMSTSYVDFPIPHDFLEGFNYERSLNLPFLNFVHFNDPIDPQGSEEEVRRITEQLAEDDNVVMIIGNSNSTLTEISLNVLIQKKESPTFLIPIATTTSLTKKAYKNGFNSLLRFPPNNELQAIAVANFCEKKSWKKVAIITDTDNPTYSLSITREISHNLRVISNNSVRVMCEEIIGFGESVYNLNNIFNNSEIPDVIIFAGLPHFGFLLVDYLILQKLSVPVIFLDGCANKDFIKYTVNYAGNTYIANIYNKDRTKSFNDYSILGKDIVLFLNDFFISLTREHPINKETVSKHIKQYRNNKSFSDGIMGEYKFTKEGENTELRYYIDNTKDYLNDLKNF